MLEPHFQGGELTQGSLFSYPRYHGRLAAIDLGKNGRSSSTFSGFPAEDASIELELLDKTIKDVCPEQLPFHCISKVSIGRFEKEEKEFGAEAQKAPFISEWSL